MNVIQVVIADDHTVVRRGVQELLEAESDITVIGTASDGETALQLTTELSPDVLLLDIKMPGLSGIEVMQQLAAADIVIPTVILSAYADPSYIHQVLAAGAAGYLTKDEDMDFIVDAVRAVAQGEKGWLSQRAAAEARAEESPATLLTSREREVLALTAQGYSNDQIANELEISERTVRFHLSNIYDKVEVESRAALIVWVNKHGLSGASP